MWLAIFFSVSTAVALESKYFDVDCDALDPQVKADVSQLVNTKLNSGKTVRIAGKCGLKNSIILRRNQEVELTSHAVLTYAPDVLKSPIEKSAIVLESDSTLSGEGKLVDSTQANSTTAILVVGQRVKLQVREIMGFETGVHLCSQCRDQDSESVSAAQIHVRLLNVTLRGIVLNAMRQGSVMFNQVKMDRYWVSFFRPRWEESIGIVLESESPHVPIGNRFSGSIESANVGMKLSGKYNRVDGLRFELLRKNEQLQITRSSAATLKVVETSFGERDCSKRLKNMAIITSGNWWFSERGRRIDLSLFPNSDPNINSDLQIQYENCLDPGHKALVSFGVEGRDIP